jgi:hypothetical protein
MIEYIVFALFLAVLALVAILLWKKQKRKKAELTRLEDNWMDIFPDIPEDFS